VLLSHVSLVVGCFACAGLLAGQNAAYYAELDGQARREFAAGDYAAAVRDLGTVAQRQPNDIAAQVLLGLALFRQGNYADSVPAYEKTLALEAGGFPLSVDQHRIVTDQLAMAYGISGALGKAHGLLDEAIRRDPRYPLNYYILACVFADEGENAKMLASLDSAFQRKAGVMKGERMPDPWTDPSFRKYIRDPDFMALVKRLSTGSGVRPTAGADK
jgi:Tfp pilus assembly protein PilF